MGSGPLIKLMYCGTPCVEAILSTCSIGVSCSVANAYTAIHLSTLALKCKLETLPYLPFLSFAHVHMSTHMQTHVRTHICTHAHTHACTHIQLICTHTYIVQFRLGILYQSSPNNFFYSAVVLQQCVAS